MILSTLMYSLLPKQLCYPSTATSGFLVWQFIVRCTTCSMTIPEVLILVSFSAANDLAGGLPEGQYLAGLTELDLSTNQFGPGLLLSLPAASRLKKLSLDGNHAVMADAKVRSQCTLMHCTE